MSTKRLLSGRVAGRAAIMRASVARACLAAVALLACAVDLRAAEPTDLWVPMRDGRKLHGILSVPEGEGPFPVVVERTPYELVSAHKQFRLLAGGGIALYTQSVRGRFQSEGQGVVFASDGWALLQDGYDTVEWLAHQPWCNGRVATIGASASGITQHLLAVAAPPSLKCQVIIVAPASLYHYSGHRGGGYEKALVELWLRKQGFDSRNQQLFNLHPSYDRWWDFLNAEKYAGETRVPALHIGGWYDIFTEGTIAGFTSRQERGGEGSRGNQRLMMGPWAHITTGQAKQGELTYPKQGIPVLIPPIREFMDKWLLEKGEIRSKPVRYFTMGDTSDPSAPGNVWRTADAWPVPAERVKFHLTSDGVLARGGGPARAASRPFAYDPKNPVPTRGGGNQDIAYGPMDQKDVESHPDVLVFSTPVLEKPIEVTGRVRARLWISSEAADTDVVARLADVHADGRSMLVCDGVARASYRGSLTRPTALTPGQVVPLDVDLWSTSIVFNKGHRIRLSVSVTCEPRYGQPPSWGAHRNTLHFGPATPSHLDLPVAALEIAKPAGTAEEGKAGG